MANLKVFKTKKKNIGVLVHNKIKFKCYLGSKGIGKKTREGDKITPVGTFKFSKVFYRPDKVKYLKTCLPTKKLTKLLFGVLILEVSFTTVFKKKKIIYVKNFIEMMVFTIYSSH